MKLTSFLRALSLTAPLLFALHDASAAAQTSTKAAAATTLDVCQDNATGNWRYSGVVSVRNGVATDTSVVRIGYWIQNRVSGVAYVDALQGRALNALAQITRAAPARVVSYSVDGPALVLGSLRSTARVSIYDPLNAAAPAINLDPTFEVSAAVCGCEAPKGCVRTQGYWGNKPGVAWPKPYSRSVTFYSSGRTWQQIFDTPPSGGNAYLILAHQYIAALLNKGSSATAPAGVQTVLSKVDTWFASGVNLDSCSDSACETQKAWAGILDSYNNGDYPGAPKSCPD